MTHEDKLLIALDAARVSPEEFGERLAVATAPVNLDSARDRARRASARSWFLTLPYGFEIITREERGDTK